MSAYHIECYNRANNANARGVECRKFESKCGICGNTIRYGQQFTWTRRGSNVAVTAPATPATPATTETPDMSDAGITKAILAAVMPAIDERVSAATADIDAIVEEVRKNLTLPRTLEIKVQDLPSVDVGFQHKKFPLLLKACAARVHAWIAGPAGSGKTTAAESAARALGLKFYALGAVNDAVALLGYKTATGETVRTLFREAYEHGGVFLKDEVDADDPTATLALQMALANGHCAFPDGMVKKHDDFVMVAAANTWGQGATRDYVGRNRLDAAFLDRFGARIEWDYDTDLELATAPDMKWCKRVQEVRARVNAKGLRVLVTPRATYNGARLLAAGLTWEEVEEMTLRSGMTSEQWAQVK